MRVMLTLAVVLSFQPAHAEAQRALSPADATVFIRLVGSIHVEVEEGGLSRTTELDRVEIGTGSGFVVSPLGYVLTNDHVVNSSEQYLVTNGIQKARITLKVARIEACFRPESATARGLSSPCFAASVMASNAELDLAVLFIGGSNVPYVALGDSDAVTAGLPADALGYPFGRDVEVGKVATARDLVPDVTTTPGAISALRADDAGERRYLQVTNTLNPGNSGGPLVDRDGYAVGVIRMKLTRAAGIGYAVPINIAKDFLESRGLDQAMPARRLRLGGFQGIERKGVGLRLPDGFADTSPFRSRIETDARPGDIALRIDRVFSPWTPKRLEQAMVGTETFEPVAMAQRDVRILPRPGSQAALIGAAEGMAAGSNEALRMDYAVVDLGAEKLVARYVGTAEAMAFNESVLRDSLASLQGQKLLAGDLAPVETLAWSTPPAAAGPGAVPMPAGWIAEPGSPSLCPGLAKPATVASATPPHQFTVVMRAAVWPAADVVPDAAACSARRGSLGDASYALRQAWLGVSYVVDGVFIRAGAAQVMQLEVLSTDQNSAYASALLAAWVKTAAARGSYGGQGP